MKISQLNLSDAMAQAIKHHAESRLDEAAACYRQIVAIQPDHADAWNGLAIIEWQRGHFDEAFRHATVAVGHGPHVWRCHQTRGLIASSMQNPGEAAISFKQASVLNPESQEAWSGLGQALQALQRPEEAIAAYARAQSLGPLSPAAANNLGVALNAMHRHEEAVSVLRLGLTHSEKSVELWYNLGNALSSLGAGPDAIDAYRHALKSDPKHVASLLNLGNQLRAGRRYPEALECYRQAISIDSRSHDAYNNLGATLWTAGRPDEAIAALRQAINLRPDSSSAYNNLGNVLKDTGRVQAAIEAFRRAMELAPGDPQPHSNLLYSLYFHPGFGEEAILAEAGRWAAVHTRGLESSKPHPRRGSSGGTLNVGYVSPDFRDHCQSLFTLPLLSHHDRGQFKVHCYAQLSAPDATSRRIEALADVWRPIEGMSDARVEDMIRSDRIDILVDLTMHMSNGRPLLFARKPAPVQVAWLAYPGTTGQPAIDYRLTDPWLDPEELGDDRYVERSLRLPQTFWCYDPGLATPEVGQLPMLAAGHVTFGCLNNFCKVSDPSLRLWGRIMAESPDSRLILLAAPGEHRRRVLDILGEFAIASQRIEFVPYQPRHAYLQTYHRIDLCLDTLPYNGHTTSLDAYWMGVPVVTRLGRTVVGRAGWSQLNNLALPQLAATDDEAFVDKAARLASDPARLSELRSSLRERMRASPLMDGPAFAAAIESVFRRISRQA